MLDEITVNNEPRNGITKQELYYNFFTIIMIATW
jgi:hypothetical protein